MQRDEFDKGSWRVAPLALLAVVACGKAAPASGSQKTKQAIEFPVESEKVTARHVEYFVDAVGSVAAFEVVQVTARVSGVIERIAFAEGDNVTTRTILVEIEPTRFQVALRSAQASQSKARAAHLEAASGFERREKVAKKTPGLITEEELDAWRAKMHVAEAEVTQADAAVAQAELNLRDAYVRAPMNGVVQTRTVQTGQYAQPGLVLATLLRKNPLLLRFRVTEREAQRIKPKQSARFRVGDEAAEHTAIIMAIADSADEASRMVDVTAKVEKDVTGLRPGQFARVRVPIGESDAPSIPQTAVRPSERGFLAFVVEDGVARERQLLLGLQTADGRVEVREGIEPGEVLVTRGGEALHEGVKVKVVASSPDNGGMGAKDGGAARGRSQRIEVDNGGMGAKDGGAARGRSR